MAKSTTLFLAGDVMTGRGIDQILPRPVDPRLREPWITSALDYVAIAERAHGPIPAPVDDAYVWGDALAAIERRRPDARIVNLETAVTRRGEPAPKGINYRMSPDHVGVLSAAGVDVCSLANNHVLDWGPTGLEDTLQALAAAGIRAAGAGRDLEDAWRPAVAPLGSDRRLVVLGCALPTAGVPAEWAADPRRAGVAFLPRPSRRAADRIGEAVRAVRRAGDIVVASLHWGPNWGYSVGRGERALARRLVEECGVDVVHGHSSHHARPFEIHRDRLILYGCGDFVNDYEGIGGHEEFRPDLVLGYVVTLGDNGALERLEVLPFRMRRFRLETVNEQEAGWLRDTLRREGGPDVEDVRISGP